MKVRELIVRDLRSTRVKHEPPDITKDGGNTHIDTHSHISKEKPSADQGLLTTSRRTTHDVMVRGIESERGRRQTVCYQIHPKQLNRNQGLGKTQEDGQEDGDDFTNVG